MNCPNGIWKGFLRGGNFIQWKTSNWFFPIWSVILWLKILILSFHLHLLQLPNRMFHSFTSLSFHHSSFFCPITIIWQFKGFNHWFWHEAYKTEWKLYAEFVKYILRNHNDLVFTIRIHKLKVLFKDLWTKKTMKAVSSWVIEELTKK